MARRRETSMRVRYFSSYMGIVLSACMLIGLLALNHSVNEINLVSRNDYYEKMALAAEEMEQQQEILENISYRVKISPMYRPFFTYRNAYYEVEIVDDIAKFKDYSPLIDEYYCVQYATGNVYSANGKLTAQQFAQYRLRTDAAWMEALFGLEIGFHVMQHPSDSATLLMVLPFRIQTDGKRTVPDTCLMFMVPKTTLLQRLERISAVDTAMLTVYWKNQLLLGEPQAEDDQTLCVTSSQGDWRVYSGLQPTQVQQRLSEFRLYFMLILAVGTVVLLILAALLAHRNYQPLDRLIDRLNISPISSAQDIDAAVRALQESNRYTSEQLQSSLVTLAHQRHMIAKQLLFAKLNGAHDERLDLLLSEAGIALNHPLFCVMLAYFEGGIEGDEAISSITWSLSDDEMNIYPAGVYQSKYYMLLLNFSAREQLDEIRIILLESLEIEKQGAALYAGDICEDMGQLAASFASALMKCATEQAQDTPPVPGGEANWYDDHQVRLMMQALREGDALKAQTCLHEALNAMAEKYPSVLLQRCIWADIGNQLLHTTKGMDVQLESTTMQRLMLSVDMVGFEQQLSEIIGQIAAASNARSEQENREMEQEVVDYIQSRFFLPQFTMTEVADHFHVSDRKIGNIVKLVTGLTYKEYIIQQRMGRAKMLLTAEGYNVSQTSESVGYNNIPYFIKTFRHYTGYTPGEYKKLFENQERL